jgi:hypothetical protein
MEPTPTPTPTPVNKLLATAVAGLCGIIFSALKGVPDEALFTGFAVSFVVSVWSLIEAIIKSGSGPKGGGGVVAIVLPFLLVGSVGLAGLAGCAGTLHPDITARVGVELHTGPPCSVSAHVDARQVPLFDYAGQCSVEVGDTCFIDEGHLFCPAANATLEDVYGTPSVQDTQTAPATPTGPTVPPTPDDNATLPEAVNLWLTPSPHPHAEPLHAGLALVLAGLFGGKRETGAAPSPTLRDLTTRAGTLAADLDRYRSSDHAPSPHSDLGRELRDAADAASTCQGHLDRARADVAARRRRGVA